jgi:hypothetical protein
MAKYLISFPSSAMVVPDGEWQAVADAAHEVIRQAKDAGVYVFGGGIDEDVAAVVVDGDGGQVRRAGADARWRIHHPGIAHARGRGRVGGADRRRVPMCAGVAAIPVRPAFVSDVVNACPRTLSLIRLRPVSREAGEGKADGSR